MIGNTLNNRYRLDRELGRGGMGTVFQGYDLLLNRVVAVKMVMSGNLEQQDKEDLLNEARAVAQLNHPNIVSVYDAGQSGEIPFVVMEYIQGYSLHDKPPADDNEILRYGMQICAALEEAHQHGIVHRDLKPENVILNDSGLIKLTDFGLARSLSTRMDQEEDLTGTVFYISPEQALGKPLDGRTDLYSLGVMLYEFAAGRLPFTGKDPLEVISQHINDLPQPPGEINSRQRLSFEGLILKLLAKDPEERFSSATEVYQELETYLSRLSRTGSKHNIPLALTSFVGRENEVLRIRDILKNARLLTLTGVGGTGKTRLALQAARGIVDDFKDGVWVVELSTIFDTDKVVRAIVNILNIRDQPDRPLLDTLIDYLQSRELLLIMDNCEHLISSCATITGQLLGTCPGLKIMATSRESMGVAGEQTFHVPSMQLPKDGDDSDIEEFWQAESMQLFKDRVLSVVPDFTPNASQTKAVAKICTRLDGIPLAIELAAARARVMPLEEISSRLSDRFRLLTGGSRSAMPRQQTLEALIDWSYDLLTEKEKILLRRLSIFMGGWILEEAEIICSNSILSREEIMDILTRLVDKSLISADTKARETRYGMLETIRQYARNKLIQSGEIEEFRNRHLTYFADFCTSISKELWRSDQVKWMDRLEEEHDNLRAALEWSMYEGCGEDHVVAGMQIATSIFVFWLVRGYWSEGLQWMLKIYEIPSIDKITENVKSRLIYSIGFLTKEIGDIHSAKDYFEEALDLARKNDDKHSQAYALLGLGEARMIERSIKEANGYVDECLKLFRIIDDKVGIAIALSRKGAIAMDNKGYEKAKDFYLENLSICREIGHILGIAGTLAALGRIENYSGGQKELGRQYLEESLEIFRKSRDKSGIAGALSDIGYADLYEENLESSRKKYEEVLRINRELRSSPGVGSALVALGEISRSYGDYKAARDYYEEALQLNQNLGQVSIVMIVAHNLGYVAKQQKYLEKALEYFRYSLEQAEKSFASRFCYFCIAGIACVYTELGRHEDAVLLLSAVDRIGKENKYSFDPVDRWEVEQARKKLEQAVAEDRWNELWKSGQRLPLEKTIEIAKDENGKNK